MAGFSNNLEELIRKDQGEVAVLLSMDKKGKIQIDSYCLPQKKKKFSQAGLRNAYLVASLGAPALDKEAQYELSSYLSSIYSVEKKPLKPNLSTASTYEVVHAQHLNFSKLFDIKRTKNK